MVFRFVLVCTVALSFAFPLSAGEPQTGSWGDQGDGTYRNPILNGDYPDVDVEKAGDTYYMISSKQHMSPGMVILESKDMVNWRTVGHVWDKLSWDPKYNWDRMDGYRFGVWAGDLTYHDPRRPDHPDASPGDRKQLVLRSKTDSIYGPYEVKVVYERGNGVIRSCSQGALMKTPDGSWWYTHQLIQNIPAPFQGRPQMLQPVHWIDGWPVIGKDVDGDGIGEPVLHHAKPIADFPITAPPTDDEFDDSQRSPQWEWNHNPRDSHWSLTERPGWLRLMASVPVGKGDFWGACNTISQRIMGTGKGEATAKFDLSGMVPGQRAGFVRFGNVYHLLGVHVDDDGTRRLFFNANGQLTTGPAIDADLFYVRTTNDGDQARFAWSTDGEAFRDFGQTFTVKFGKWTGDRLGFFCWSDREPKGHIDVDWFRYQYDGPRGGLKDR